MGCAIGLGMTFRWEIALFAPVFVIMAWRRRRPPLALAITAFAVPVAVARDHARRLQRGAIRRILANGSTNVCRFPRGRSEGWLGIVLAPGAGLLSFAPWAVTLGGPAILPRLDLHARHSAPRIWSIASRRAVRHRLPFLRKLGLVGRGCGLGTPVPGAVRPVTRGGLRARLAEARDGAPGRAGAGSGVRGDERAPARRSARTAPRQCGGAGLDGTGARVVAVAFAVGAAAANGRAGRAAASAYPRRTPRRARENAAVIRSQPRRPGPIAHG